MESICPKIGGLTVPLSWVFADKRIFPNFLPSWNKGGTAVRFIMYMIHQVHANFSWYVRLTIM